jgi:hypothetical protein
MQSVTTSYYALLRRRRAESIRGHPSTDLSENLPPTWIAARHTAYTIIFCVVVCCNAGEKYSLSFLSACFCVVVAYAGLVRHAQ